MSVAEELSRLDELRTRGVLSEDEFQRAKQRLLDGAGAPPAAPPVALAINRFRRSTADRWIGGVCGGLGVVSGVESWIWRLILVALALFGGTGVLLYILLWIFVPNE
jgi:phage shock protein C